MPRVNIYIRNDDWEAWENISDKPQWIHEGLTTGMVVLPPRSVQKKPKENLAVSLAGEPDYYALTPVPEIPGQFVDKDGDVVCEHGRYWEGGNCSQGDCAKRK